MTDRRPTIVRASPTRSQTRIACASSSSSFRLVALWPPGDNVQHPASQPPSAAVEVCEGVDSGIARPVEIVSEFYDDRKA